MNIPASDDLSLLIFIAQIVVFGVAAFLHGITGMAFPMIGTTALSLAFSLPKAIIMVAIPSLIINIVVLVSNNQGSIGGEIAFYLKNMAY